MQFQCSKCHQLIKAAEQHFGKLVKCPKCGTNLKVPDAPGKTGTGSFPSAERLPVSRFSDPLIGKQIAHYKIESLLGQGGMGKVYKAHNLRLEKVCAVKVLPPEFARQDESRIARFVREARSAAQIDHPNVLPVQFVGNVGEHYFIEMNYVDGGTLDDVLTKRVRLDANAAARIIREAAMGLQAAHEQGIVHRDVKPSNVMLTKRGRVLVADFGLAKMGETSSALTMDGKVVGTPLYISPEQADGVQADPRSDIYSLGVMFYQMLTGNPPYTAESPLAILMQHKEAPIPDVMQLAPGTPKPIADLVRRMMAKNPDERPRSGYAVAKELSDILGVTPPPPPGEVSIGALAQAKAPKAPRKRSRAPLYIAGVAVVVLMATVALFLLTRPKGSEAPAPETKQVAAKPTAERIAPREQVSVPAVVKQEQAEPIAQIAKELAEPPAPKPTTPKTPAKPAPSAVPEEKTEAAREEKEPVQVEAKSAEESAPETQPEPSKPEVDLVAYCQDIKPVNDLIDEMKYNDAGSRANLLKSKYPDLIDRKLKNLEAARSLRQRCIERINSGAAKVTMADISRRYAFAGPVKKADDTGLTAAIKKRWDSFDKEEIVSFYRKASDPTSPEDAIGIAAFLVEGNSPDLDAAMIVLGQAAKHRADVSPYLNYIENLKKSQAEYAEAEKRGKALETAAVERRGGALPPPEVAVPKVEGPEPKAASYDDVYVTTAATGEKIPHPLSHKTYKIVYQGKKIDVPEGMVFVPAGPFLMGKGTEPPEGPQHEVYLDAYFIDKYEVTNAEYMEFVKATNHPMPRHWVDNGNKIPEGRENHPVVYVSWEDAKAYCDWCGKRLPTEAEWEKAAGWDLQNRRPREYPWGDDYDPGRANHCYQLGCRCNGDGKIHTPWWEKWSKSDEGKKIVALGGNTAPVGKLAGDVSFFGCVDMAGNVREWVAGWYDPGYYQRGPKKNPTGPTEEEAPLIDTGSKTRKQCRVLRGGGWYFFLHYLRRSLRIGFPPASRQYYLGFRCAADYPWKPATERGATGGAPESEGGRSAEAKAEAAASSEAKAETEPKAESPEPKADIQVAKAPEKSRHVKEPKPPKTLIAKCGELVLQDDFEREDIAPWEIARGKVTCSDGRLVMESSAGDYAWANVRLPFQYGDFVADVLLRCSGQGMFRFSFSDPSHVARAALWGYVKRDTVYLHGGKRSSISGLAPVLASHDMSFKGPISFVLEKVGDTMVVRIGKLTLSGKGSDLPGGEGEGGLLEFGAYEGLILEVDHIYVWKAEPKKKQR